MTYDWPRLHAALNDLPAALLLVAVLFDLVGAATKRPALRQAGFWTLLVGVLGAVAAVLSGLQAEDEISHGDTVHRVMETHELLGFVTLGIFAVVAVWRVLRESRMSGTERTFVAVLSAAGAAVVMATGIYGGKLVFDHAAGIPTSVLTSEIANREAGHSHEGGAAHGHGAYPAADSAAAAGVAPGASTPAAPMTADSSAGHTHAPGTPAHSH